MTIGGLAARPGQRRWLPGWRCNSEGGAVLKDLAVLTPPLVVCVAILIGVRAFLRHEMAPRRRAEDDESGPYIDNEISGETEADTSQQRDHADTPEHD
ncbi:MAG TPA: hypothetical protein VGI64_21510 [Streptosporangiaceae bacterium]